MKRLLLMLFAVCAVAQAAEPELKIGWGRRSINPGRPVAITGQFYLRVSIGEYNPVMTEALVIENGRDAVIFASVDTVMLRGGILDRVQAKLRSAAPEIPADKIVMNATHTHAGPSFSTAEPAVEGLTYMPTEAILDFLSTQIADAILTAWKSRAPGAVAYGYGFATVGHSRRTVYLSHDPKIQGAVGAFTNGLARMYGNTGDPNFSHYEAGTDAFINLLYTFDTQGKLTGAVVNVPCPAQTNENAWELHAGFWHPVREKLRAKHGDIGIIAQCAAAGDLSPRQLHYNRAEQRRYRLKYPRETAAYLKRPLRYPDGFFTSPEARQKRFDHDLTEMLRAEDIARRIAAAFDEVLEWAGKDKLAAPVLRHRVRGVKLDRRLVSEEEYRTAKANYEQLLAEKRSAAPSADPHSARTMNARINRCLRVVRRYEMQKQEPQLATTIHAVRIGDAAFASNRFELFIDFMHRIQGRSPFVQTFIVQIAADPGTDGGSYLATERAARGKGYSATITSNQVSPAGGQQLVEQTLDLLDQLRR